MIEPERFPWIAEALLKRGYSETHAQGIFLGSHQPERCQARMAVAPTRRLIREVPGS